MMKKHVILLFFIVFILVGGNFGGDYQTENKSTSYLKNDSIANLELNYVPSIEHDGVVTTNEYEYSFVQHSSPNYVVHYTINRSVMYMALEVEAKGWIRVGVGYYTSGDDADIIVGYVDGTDGTTYIQDSYSDGNGNHEPDTVDNILSYAGSENDTSTILEFSRKLDTGDKLDTGGEGNYLDDYEIVPGLIQAFSWAFHDTADDFTTPQLWQNSGSIRISLYGEPTAPYDAFALPEVGKVGLYWTESKGDGDETTWDISSITHYNIYRSHEGSDLELIDNVASTEYYSVDTLSYTDASVTSGDNYSYAVTAVTSDGESGYSNIADVMPISESDVVTNISHDGLIAPGEYEFYYVLHSSPLYIVHYTINQSTLYVGLEVETQGWVRVGFGYYTGGNDADVTVGYVDGTDGTTYIQDSYDDGYRNHEPDTVDNILSYAGSETATKTIIEFSRLLNTGDKLDTGGKYNYLDDYEIIPGVNLGLTWAFHNTADDFTTQQSWYTGSSGSMRVPLNGDPGSPYDAFAILNVGKVDLIWTKPKGDGNETTSGTQSLTHYNIYRSHEGGDFQLIGNFSLEDYYDSPALVTYTDENVINDDLYSYTITAVTSHGESGYSNIIDAIPLSEASAAPYNADGIISPGEYQYYTIIRTNPDFIIHYTIIQSTIHIALEVEAKGWVSLGLNYGMDMEYSDIIIGYYDDTDGSSHIEDNHAITPIAHVPDASNDLLSGYVSETDTVTIMEFSRLLDTGDSPDDYPIIPNLSTRSLWGAHDTADDFFSYHDDERLFGKIMLTFLGPPEAPINFYATVDEAQVDLYWDEPRGDDGHPTTSYNIYRSHIGGEFQLIDTLPYSYSLGSYTDTNVITGDTYSYYMTAVNEDGESGDSEIVTVIPIGQLTAPKNLGALVNSGQIELTWDVPLDDGGIPIEEYFIYRSDIIDGEYSYIGTNTSDNSYTDLSVINGLPYYYMVRASHRILIGEASDIVNANPIGVSSPPLDIITTAGDSIVVVNWTIPFSDGGFAIAGYSIHRSENQGGPYTFVGTNTSPLGYLDETTENAKTYYYVVTASNSFGESGYSSEQQVTLENVPNNPTDLIVVNGDNQVYLEWAEADGKGYEITSYAIYRASAIGEKYEYITSTTQIYYTDFTTENGGTYIYIVTASNMIGESSYSSQITGLPGSTPSIPLGYSGKSTNSHVELVWDEPEDNGGYFISYYNIYRSTTPSGEYEKIGISYAREYIDESVIVGITYYYIISGVNTLGEGIFSEEIAVTPGTKADAPIDLVSNVNNEGIELQWAAPYDGGVEITQYNVYRSKVSGEPYDFIGITLTTSFIDDTYSAGQIYYYVVTASNLYGEGEYSSEASIIPSGLPSAPENLIGFAADNQVLIGWDLSNSDGGSPITAYKIYRSTTDGGNYTLIDSILSIVYTDNTVENNQTYYYVITAQNPNGESEYSNMISITPVDSDITFDFYNTDNTDLTDNTNLSKTEINQLEGDQILNTSLGVVGLTIFAVLMSKYWTIMSDVAKIYRND